MSDPVLSRFRLDGQLALVTGASSGIGRHFAGILAAAGARVAVVARRKDKLAETVQAIKQAGGEARAFTMDVTNAADVRRCFDDVTAWGVPDIIVCNAGTSVTRALLEQTEDDWDRVVDTNLKGAWMVATEAARRMVAAGKAGNIVNVASILGARVASGVSPYTISKAGLVQSTKAMALELSRYGIRVNALLPGYIVTDLNRDFLQSEAGEKLRLRIPGRKFGALQDLEGPLLLLVSPAGSAMSGAIVAVDHGHLVSSL